MTFSRLAGAVGLLLIGGFLAWGQSYTISTYAGGAPPPTPVPGVSASIGQPTGVATDAAGNVYFSSDNCVFKLDRNGVLTRVAGNSRAGYSGDGGPGTNAQLNKPDGVAVDTAGNVYIADTYNNRIRKVTAAGIITTVAGGGSAGLGDGASAANARLETPIAVAVDGAANLYIADRDNARIRKVTAAGIITTIAGNGTVGYSGDGGPAASAQFSGPGGVAVDGVGNLYVADYNNKRIRKVTATGIITTIAGNGTAGSSGDDGLATDGELVDPLGVAVDSAGNVYIADYGNHRIRKVTAAGIITTVAGNGTYSGDGGPAISAKLDEPFGVAVDSTGTLYIAEYANSRIRKVTPAGVITTVAGNGTPSYSGDGGPATGAQFFYPTGVTVDNKANVYIADAGNYRIRKVTAAGIITTIAGNGTPGDSGDGGPATSAEIVEPSGVGVDSTGTVYIAESGTFRVRKVTSTGIITTMAGNGTPGYSGDGGPATGAQISGPGGVAVDGAGNVYIADSGNNRIRKVTPAGIITTIAGNGTPGYSGDGGPATDAQISAPSGVAVDGAGNVYIVDSGNRRLRRVTPAGIITAFPDNGIYFAGGVAVDSAGNVYIASFSGISKVTPSGIITMIAGNGSPGYSGDGGPATSASLNVSGLAVDSAGNVYIVDPGDFAIRLLTPTTSTNAPAVLPGGIVPAYSSINTIQSGEWISIYGTNLAGSIMSWNGTFTTSLGGTSVTINGKPAYLSYVSPDQINAQAPDDTATGTVAVVVTAANGTANGTATLAAFAPSFLLLDGKHVAGIIARKDGSGAYGGGTYDILGPTGSSLGYATVAAKPGDAIELFAVGLGPTNPAVPAGQVFSGAAAVVNPVMVLVNSVGVSTSFAGLSGAGLYQINLTVPQGLGTGDVPLQALAGGAQTQSGVVISLQ